MVYNIADGGRSPMKGRHHSKESKQKLSIANSGKKRTEETKKRISQSSMGKPGTNAGKIFSQEWRDKISKAQRGKENREARRFSDKEELEICRLYIEEKQSTYVIAKRFGCYRSILVNIFKRRGIVARKDHSGYDSSHSIFTPEQGKEICETYLAGKYNMSELAKQYKCYWHTIKRVLLRHGIIVRSTNKFTPKDESEICDTYLTGKLGQIELAKQHNCHQTTIRNILLRHNIITSTKEPK
jgi:transposase-like protein